MQEPVPQEGSIEAAQTGNRSEEPLVLFQPLELYMLSAFVQRTDSKGFLLRFTEMGDTHSLPAGAVLAYIRFQSAAHEKAIRTIRIFRRREAMGFHLPVRFST
jgi:hypothetical protein